MPCAWAIRDRLAFLKARLERFWELRHLTFAAEREGADALVRRALDDEAERPDALGAATALVTWTPAKEEVAAIMVVGV